MQALMHADLHGFGERQGLPDAVSQACIRAWNLMGGQIEFSAVPMLAHELGFDDVTLLLEGLDVIRDYMTRERP